MGLFDIFNKQKKEVEVTPKGVGASTDAFSITNGLTNTPLQTYTKSRDGYQFGQYGLYPQELNQLYNASPLQNNIINFKSLLTSGDGYELIDEPKTAMEKIALNQLLVQINKVIPEITSDYFIHNRFALKVTWNADNTKVIKVESLPVDGVRILSVTNEMRPLRYVFNFDWEQKSKFDSVEYPAFDQSNTEEKCQVLMFQQKSPGKKIYTLPSYQSAIQWVNLDSEMASYHNSNINNSLNPSMLIQYFEKPNSDEEKSEILHGINQSFAGAAKTGRAMVTFSDGQDLAPTVTQMEPNKLDKTFLGLTDTIQRQICYAHSIDPLILGLKTPGSLGNSGEFEYAFNLFLESTVKPSQKVLEDVLNELIAINGLVTKVEFKEPNIASKINKEETKTENDDK